MKSIEFAIQKMAIAPPFLKSGFWERIGRRLVVHSDLKFIDTNLGISSKIRTTVPASEAALLFGSPKLNETELPLIKLMKVVAPRSDCFVDVGANFGLFSFLYRLANSHGALFAFEPDPAIFTALNKSFEENGINGVALNTAIGTEEGRIDFFVDLDDRSMGSIVEDFATSHRRQRISVSSQPLDQFMRKNELAGALVKVDVEGAGTQVWESLRQETARVDWMFYEVLANETNAVLPSRIISEGQFHGYYCCGNHLVHTADGAYEYVAPYWNWLFCRVSPESLAPIVAPIGMTVV